MCVQIVLNLLSVSTRNWAEIHANTGDTKKRELLKNPIKIEEIQEKNLLTEIEPLKLAF